MDKLKEKLFGLIVVIALGIIFIPMLFNNSAEQQTNLAKNSPSSSHLKSEAKSLHKPPVLTQLHQADTEASAKGANQEIEVAVNSAELAPTPSVSHNEEDHSRKHHETVAASEPSTKEKRKSHRVPGIVENEPPAEAKPVVIAKQEEKPTKPEVQAKTEEAKQESTPIAQQTEAVKISKPKEKAAKKKELQLAHNQNHESEPAQSQQAGIDSHTLPLHRPLDEEPQHHQEPAAHEQPAVHEEVVAHKEIAPEEEPSHEVSSHEQHESASAKTTEHKKLIASKKKAETNVRARAGWAIQMGAFAYPEHATALTNKLKSAGYPAYIRHVNRDGQELSLVFVGPQARKDDAAKTKGILENKYKLKAMLVHYNPT